MGRGLTFDPGALIALERCPLRMRKALRGGGPISRTEDLRSTFLYQ
jgi:hypothetical protein